MRGDYDICKQLVDAIRYQLGMSYLYAANKEPRPHERIRGRELYAKRKQAGVCVDCGSPHRTKTKRGTVSIYCARHYNRGRFLMWPSILQAFPKFTDSFEGCLGFMYLDVKCLVTTGRGNLIDPSSAAMNLPWLLKSDSSPATVSEIVSEWSRVKGMTSLALAGGGAFAQHTSLFLPQRSLDAILLSVLAGNDASLQARFQNWSSLSADAQLCVHSMVWACGRHGVEFEFPKFEAAILASDFTTAAAECQMNATGNPGLVPRNKANMKLMQAAASVAANNLDPSVIHGWP